MKHHDGKKRINKVDGGKRKAKKQYHKKLRTAGLAESKKECVIPEYAFQCDDCNCYADETDEQREERLIAEGKRSGAV